MSLKYRIAFRETLCRCNKPSQQTASSLFLTRHTSSAMTSLDRLSAKRSNACAEGVHRSSSRDTNVTGRTEGISGKAETDQNHAIRHELLPIHTQGRL